MCWINNYSLFKRRKTEINTEEIVNKLNNGRLAKRAEDEEIAKDEAFIAAAFRCVSLYSPYHIKVSQGEMLLVGRG